MSIESYVVAQISFSTQEKRDLFFKSFDKVSKIKNVFDDPGFSEALTKEFKDVYQREPDFWCNVFDAQIEKVDDSAVEIFLEGSAASSIITDISQFFENDDHADIYLFEMADFEYYFSVYSKEEREWQELTYSMKENCNELLDDYDLTLQSKFYSVLNLYKEGRILPKPPSSNADIFRKIADTKIDPYDDGYIFEIQDALVQNEEGETIITAAVRANNIEVLSFVSQQVDADSIHAPNAKGQAPLEVAKEVGDQRMIEMVENLV